MINLENLSLEITRRCNELCPGFCMRGKAENLDMSKEIVNKIFFDNDIECIEDLFFSGGEPTLNEELICYIVELIIENHMKVEEIQIITNGKYYPKLALEALNDYQNYCSKNKIGHPGCWVGFSFSIDPFHENYLSLQKLEVKQQYFSNYPQFIYLDKFLEAPTKTGKCPFGEEFIYEIEPIYVACNFAKNRIMTSDTLYVTAKGNYETIGDGSYYDMDKINMGSVFEKSILDILEEYGQDISGSNSALKRIINLSRQNKNLK